MQKQPSVAPNTDNAEAAALPNLSSLLSAFHAHVLDSMSEGVSVSAENGVIFYINPALDTMFGYGHGELLGRHVKELNAYEPEENERIVNEVIACLRQQGAWKGEWRNRRHDGTIFIPNRASLLWSTMAGIIGYAFSVTSLPKNAIMKNWWRPSSILHRFLKVWRST